jgi:Ca2+-binding EF-hand superfamily protein
VLPALSTIDPLLLSTQEAFFQPCAKKKAPDEQEQKSMRCAASRQSNIDRVVQRLYPGAEWQMEDVEVLDWLTRPKTGQPVLPPLDEPKPSSKNSKDRKGKGNQSPEKNCDATIVESLVIESLDGNRRPCSNLDRKHKFDNHYDLFEACLTPSSRSGIRPQLPHMQPRKGSKDAPLAVSNIEVVPEDAATAFFKAEEKAEQLAEKRAMDRATKKRNSLQGRVTNLLIAPQSSRSGSKESNSSSADPAQAKQRQVSKEWAQVLNAVVSPSGGGKMLEKPVRAASEALRILCFGSVGNEQERRHFEKEKVFYETSGTPEQLANVWKFWTVLDADGSNRVDIGEFNSYTEKCENKKACDKVAAVLLAKKSSFTFEDMLRSIWPCAQAVDIDKMKKMVKEQVRLMQRVKTPPLLDHSEFEGLVQTFRHFDADGSGTVSVQELVNCGLLDADQSEHYIKEWDEDGTGELNELEFSRMLCPVGFRAYPDARIATDMDGNQVVLEPNFGWRLRNTTVRTYEPKTTVASTNVEAELLL